MKFDLSEVPEELKRSAQIEEVCFGLTKQNFQQSLDILKSITNLDPNFLLVCVCQASVCHPYNYKLYGDLLQELNFKYSEFSQTSISDYLAKRGILTNYKIQDNSPIEKFENIFEKSSISEIIFNDDIEKLQILAKSKDITNEIIEYELFELLPLDLAAFLGSPKCFKYLYSLTNEFTEDTAFLAARGGNEEIIEFLKNKNESFKGCLPAAVQYHHHELASYILENYGDDEEFTPEYSIQTYNTIAFSYFLRKGHEITTSILEAACKNGHYEIVIYILSKKKNIEFGNSLENAVTFGFKNIVEELFKAGANINQKVGCCDDSLLHLACEHGFLGIVEFLVNNGLDPKANNSYSVKPIDKAKGNGHIHVMKYLLQFYTK